MSETTLRLDRPLKMVTICLGQMQTNCYIVENTKTNQAFVFDPGDQGERIMNTLEEDGMELAGVCLTHGHFDHVMALPYLMEQKPDLDIYLYEDEADVLADPQLNLGAMMGMDLSLKANHLVKDGEIIDVLGTKVKCNPCSRTYKRWSMLLFCRLWMADLWRYTVPDEHWKNRLSDRQFE